MDLVKKYNGALDWNIGTLFNHADALLPLLRRIGPPEMSGHNIRYVFGGFNCKFNSGRACAWTPDLEWLKQRVDDYNELGINCRLTFSNHLIEEADLDDPSGNALLEHLCGNNRRYPGIINGVILSSDLLRDYVRKTYGSLQLISSLFKPAVEVGYINDNVSYYNRLFDAYDIVVVNSSKIKNGDRKFLVSLAYPERVEFIANNWCIRNCPFAMKHCSAVARAQLAVCRGDGDEVATIQGILNDCLASCKQVHDSNPTTTGLLLSYDEIDLLLSLGYTHFKIQGRNDPLRRILEDIGHYVFNRGPFVKLVREVLGENMNAPWQEPA